INAVLVSVSPFECVYDRSSANTWRSAASSPATVAEAHNFSWAFTASADLSAASANPAITVKIVNNLIGAYFLSETGVMNSIAETGVSAGASLFVRLDNPSRRRIAVALVRPCLLRPGDLFIKLRPSVVDVGVSQSREVHVVDEHAGNVGLQ